MERGAPAGAPRQPRRAHRGARRRRRRARRADAAQRVGHRLLRRRRRRRASTSPHPPGTRVPRRADARLGGRRPARPRRAARGSCTLRTGLVLAPSGGLLGPLKLVFRFALGGRIGSGTQYMPWISLDDEVGAIGFLLEDGRGRRPGEPRRPTPVTNAEFTAALATALHRPAPFAVPASVIRTLAGSMGEEMLLYGQRAVPAKLEAAGYRFRHRPRRRGARRGPGPGLRCLSRRTTSWWSAPGWPGCARRRSCAGAGSTWWCWRPRTGRAAGSRRTSSTASAATAASRSSTRPTPRCVPRRTSTPWTCGRSPRRPPSATTTACTPTATRAGSPPWPSGWPSTGWSRCGTRRAWRHGRPGSSPRDRGGSRRTAAGPRPPTSQRRVCAGRCSTGCCGRSCPGCSGRRSSRRPRRTCGWSGGRSRSARSPCRTRAWAHFLHRLAAGLPDGVLRTGAARRDRPRRCRAGGRRRARPRAPWSWRRTR